jgi:hypothetical protein
MAANEASAVGSLRTINTAEVTYSSTYPQIGFAKDLATLGGASATCATSSTSTAACLLDDVLAQGTKSGYTFAAAADTTSTPSIQYIASGIPVKAGQTGQRGFCTDQSGVIRFEGTGATAQTTVTACQALTALQ